jgi:hypothetical protein
MVEMIYTILHHLIPSAVCAQCDAAFGKMRLCRGSAPRSSECRLGICGGKQQETFEEPVEHLDRMVATF